MAWNEFVDLIKQNLEICKPFNIYDQYGDHILTCNSVWYQSRGIHLHSEKYIINGEVK